MKKRVCLPSISKLDWVIESIMLSISLLYSAISNQCCCLDRCSGLQATQDAMGRDWNVWGRWLIWYLRAPGRRWRQKEGSAQQLAHSTRRVFLLFQISILDGPSRLTPTRVWKNGFGKNEVLFPKGQSRRIRWKASRTASCWDPTGVAHWRRRIDFHVPALSQGSGDGEAK